MDYSMLFGEHVCEHQDEKDILKDGQDCYERMLNEKEVLDLEKLEIEKIEDHFLSLQSPRKVRTPEIKSESFFEKINGDSSSDESAMTLSPTNLDNNLKNTMLNILQNRLSINFQKKDIIILKSIGSNRTSEFQKCHGGILSKKDEKRRIYYFGIIDLLQKWNSNKKVESLFKGMINEKSKISAIEPNLYAKRFYEFIENLLE